MCVCVGGTQTSRWILGSHVQSLNTSLLWVFPDRTVHEDRLGNQKKWAQAQTSSSKRLQKEFAIFSSFKAWNLSTCHANHSYPKTPNQLYTANTIAVTLLMELRFPQPRFTCQTIPAQAAFNRILKISNLRNENVRKPVNVQILVIAKTFRTCESLVRNRCCSQVTSGVWKQAAADFE